MDLYRASEGRSIADVARELGIGTETFRTRQVPPMPRPGAARDRRGAHLLKTQAIRDQTLQELRGVQRSRSGGTPVVLALDVADAEAVFAQAVAAGAAIRQPLADMFWDDLHGQLEDPFGHRWNIAQHLRDVPHDEVVAAARALTWCGPAQPSADGMLWLRRKRLSGS
jgi:hypothetical protein